MADYNYIRKMNLFQLFTATIVLAFKNFWALTLINVVTWFPSLGYILMGLFMGPSTIAASNAILGRPIKLGDSYRRGMSFDYLLKFALVLLPTFVLFILLNNPVFYFYDGFLDFSYFDEFFGDFFTIFLLYFLLYPLYVFFPMVYLIEKRSFGNALKRTFQIIWGNKGRLAVVTILLLIFWPIYNLTIGLQLYYIFLSDVFSVYLLAFFLVPFYNLFYMLMYYEYRARHENYNEEILAQDMGYQPMQEMMSI